MAAMDGTRRLLLLSNGAAPGRELFDHAWEALAGVLGGARRVAFVPFARADHETYTGVIASALAPLGVEVIGAHTGADARDVIAGAEAVFVGGGNSFRLLDALQRRGLVELIRTRVGEGMPYIGSSAGTNMACPSLRTTNDMPIVQPASFEALGLVPFQINPHFPAAPAAANVGETREQRIAEFLEENDVPVVGLREGSWIEVRGDTARLGGVAEGWLFVRGAGVQPLLVGDDLSALLAVEPRFDRR
jgi:dipeptidase E